MTIEPDDKDWTWVLQRACSECGFDADRVSTSEIAQQIRDNLAVWHDALRDPDAAVRPAANVWSPLEYACHVRDVHRVFAGRVRQMLEQDDPLFANWDQDVTAIEERYAEQDPAVVGDELGVAAAVAASSYDEVTGSGWERPGRRDSRSGNGSVFTIASLGRYHLHDVFHHSYDIDAEGSSST